jgi:lysophospholipase L1-like esterase
MWISFLAIMLAATLFLFAFTHLVAERLVRRHHGQKKDFFRHYPVQRGDIVFLGDSITDGARWDELFPGLPVKNRGINADTVEGVAQRLDSILSGQPAQIFILIGTNDLPWYIYHNDAAILIQYEIILQRCKNESPQTQVFVQSILPRHPRYASRIQNLNQQLKSLAEKYQYEFIDLFPHFAGENGQMLAELSNDQLHLMGAGYARWVELIKPIISRIQS